jgi:hypothetical protein
MSMHYKISSQRARFAVIPILFAGFCAYGNSGPYGKLPLSFEPNHGQTSSSVQWLARGPEYTFYIAGTDAVLQLNKITPHRRGAANAAERSLRITSSAIRMRLLGAKPAQQTSGEDPQPGKANYLSGKDPAKWQRDVPMFGKVLMRSVYPGVDLLYYGRQGQLEYDFVLAPGADASAIRLQFDGAQPSLGANGDLVLPVDGGEEVRFNKPAVYQTKDGVRQPVEGRFEIDSEKQVSFHLGAYDRSRELVIDPTLDFLGILGTGSVATSPAGMTVDALGEIIITGSTADLDFPATTGAYQTTCGAVTSSANLFRCGPDTTLNWSSAFVAKIGADGQSLVYATYLHGASGYEAGYSVAADLAGNAYVLGRTNSSDFPITADAYEPLCSPIYPLNGIGGGAGFYPIASNCMGSGNGGGGPSLFISKLNATGSALLYSTFFGGTAGAYPFGIALDSSNNIYFTSALNEAPANTTDYYPYGGFIPFPTAPPNAPGPAGSTYQPSGPVNAAYQPFGAGSETNAAALSKLSADGHTLLYSTLLTALDVGNYNGSTTPLALAVGPNGIAYIGGVTNESNFPLTSGVVKGACLVSSGTANCKGPTGFLSAFDTTMSGAASLVYSTFIGGTEIGGNNPQQVLGLAADSSNNVYVTGNTQATDYPTTAGAYQTRCTPNSNSMCQNTAFLSKINPTGTAYIWSTLYGGNNLAVSGEAIALDGQGRVYLYGLDAGGYGVFANPIQPPKYGNDKPFIAAFSSDGAQLEFATQVGNSSTTTNENDEPIPSGGLAVDAAGNMYFAGSTSGSGLLTPTPGAYATTAENFNNRAFFGKISCLVAPCPALPPPNSNSIGLVVSPSTTSLGETVTMTATVTGQQGQPTPTGLVAFYNGSTWLGQATLDGNGIATFSSSALLTGVYAVTAVYLGDHLYPGATSASQSLTILSAPPATTTTTSNATLTYSASVQQVTLTATVTSASGVVNTGFVIFDIGGIIYQQPPAAAVQNGTASVTITFQGAPLAPKVGSYPIETTYTDPSSSFATSTDSAKQLTVSTAMPVITWANPAGISPGIALGSTQLNATANTPGTFVYNPPLGTVLATGSGQTLSTTFTPTDSTDYTSATASVTINVGGSNSTTTVAGNAQVNFSQSTQPVTLTAAVTSGSGVVNTGTVNFSVTFPQAVPYTASAPVVNGVANASFTVPAGNFLAVPGSYPIAAAYVPSGNLEASSDNTRQLTISKAPLVITWATPSPISNGTPLEFGQLNAAVTPGAAFPTCAYTPPLGTVLPGPGTYTLSVTCTPANTAEYIPATATVSITVSSQVTTVPLTIVWANPAPIANSAALGPAQLNAIASPLAASATCVYTPPAGTVFSTPGNYSLSVTCTPASSQLANYTASTAAVSIQVVSVTRATPAIAWATPAAITTGTALSGTQLNATAVAGAPVSFTVPGTFVYTPPAGTVPPVGNNEALSVTFTPTDTTSYQTATARVYISVISTAIAVSLETAVIPFSASPTPAILTANVTNASSTGAVAFTVLGQTTGQAQVVNGVAWAFVTIPGGTQAGSYPIVANYSDPINPSITASGSANLVISPPKVTLTANSLTTPYSSSASVVTLTANVANATSSGYVFFASQAGINNGVAHVVNGVASGAFTISAGTPMGNYPITADYTDPQHPGVFSSGTATLSIGLVTPTVNWPTPQAIFSGTLLSSAQLNATASVPGTFVYNPPAGTILPLGIGQVLSVTFVPANAAIYTTAMASAQINVFPAVTVTLGSPSATYSPAAQAIVEGAEFTNYNLFDTPTVSFSLLGSTVAVTVLPYVEVNMTIPAGTPVGTYPIVATYVDSVTGLTATGTGQLTITEPPASSCPASSTSSESSAQFKIPGAPNGSVLNPGGAAVPLTRWNGPKTSGNPLLTPSNEMISGSVTAVDVNNDGTGGGLITGTVAFPPGTFPPDMFFTGGAIRVTVQGGTYVSELTPSTPSATIVACAAFSFVPTVLPVLPLTPLATLIANFQDPATQYGFGVQITQQVTVSGATPTASATHEARGKLVTARLLAVNGAASVSMDSPALAGLPGATLTFTGTLANSSGAGQYINGAEVILNGFNANNFDLSNFLVNAPPILANGTTTSSFDFFTVTIPAQFASGPYSGQLGIFGGSTSSDQNLLGIVNFTVQVGGAVISPNSACDLNRDGVTDVTDVQAILNLALGTSLYAAGDLNGDGAVNVVDVQFVIAAALNYGCAADTTAVSGRG